MQNIINKSINDSSEKNEDGQQLQGNSSLGRDLPDTEEQLFELDKFPLLDVEDGIKKIGDETILRTLLHMMIDQAIPDDVISIQKAFAEKDWQRVEELAHRMKAGALYCGTIKMQYACQYLERYRKAGHSTSLEKLYHQLIQVLEETKHHIALWLKK